MGGKWGQRHVTNFVEIEWNRTSCWQSNWKISTKYFSEQNETKRLMMGKRCQKLKKKVKGVSLSFLWIWALRTCTEDEKREENQNH